MSEKMDLILSGQFTFILQSLPEDWYRKHPKTEENLIREYEKYQRLPTLAQFIQRK